jgi:hypothetical protein
MPSNSLLISGCPTLSKESQSLAAYETLADKLTPGTAKCLTGALKKLRNFQAFLRGAPFALLFRAWTLLTDSSRHTVSPIRIRK